MIRTHVVKDMYNGLIFDNAGQCKNNLQECIMALANTLLPIEERHIIPKEYIKRLCRENFQLFLKVFNLGLESLIK